MRVHVLQHVPFEGLGSIATWLDQRKATVSWTKFFEGNALPRPARIDLVIALGGPMSVNDEDQLGWLRKEKQFLANVVQEEKAVLGICLGAQLVASSLGAPVYAGPEKEIGWFPVMGQGVSRGAFTFPESIEVFHWHGETFELPAGARLLASSQAFKHQAFQVGPRVMGLQFHLEMTPASVEAMIANCRQELVPQRFIQGEADLRSLPDSAYRKVNALMIEVLEFLTRKEG
jgi:GMP synthase-like glutamine amidotransferase